jgi:cytochrome c oxidase subunit 2
MMLNRLAAKLPWRIMRLAVPFAALALAVLVLPLPALAKSGTHVVELNLAQYQFDPGRVQVGVGDRVIIEITSSDVVHGFYLDGYGISERVEPDHRRIELVADQPGKFRYRCSVGCGPCTFMTASWWSGRISLR